MGKSHGLNFLDHRCTCLWRFNYDVFRRLVFTKTVKNGMSEVAIIGPAGERDLCHQLWRNPMHPAAARSLLRQLRHRDVPGFNCQQSFRQRLQPLTIKSRSDATDIAQRLVRSIPGRQQQCAEPLPCPLRIGEADNHKLLLQRTLQFQPGSRPPRCVRSAHLFRDDPLQPQLTHMLQHLRSIVLEMISVAQGIRRTPTATAAGVTCAR